MQPARYKGTVDELHVLWLLLLQWREVLQAFARHPQHEEHREVNHGVGR